MLDLLALRLPGWLSLVARLSPLVVDLPEAVRGLVLRFLDFRAALHERLNLTILEDLALSVHLTDARIAMLRIVVDDGLIAAATATAPVLLAHESAEAVASSSVTAATLVRVAGVGLGLRQVLNHVPHLAEEFVLLPIVGVAGQP